MDYWPIYAVMGLSFLISAAVIISCLRNGGLEDHDTRKTRKLF